MTEYDLELYIEINRATLDQHSDAVLIKDPDLRYRYINKAYLNESKYTIEQIINNTNYKFHPKELADEFVRTDRIVLETKQPISYEQKIDVQSGDDRNFVVNKSPIFDHRGEIIGLYISARNIDEQVTIRNELQTNLNLIELLLDAVPYPIFIKDLDGRYIKINRAYAKDLDMQPEDIVGKNDIELYGEELGIFYQQKDLKVIKEGERDVYISKGVQENVKYITTKDLLRNNEGKVIGIVGITNTFQEVSNIQEDLINIQRIESLSQLAGGIAHDMNNILTNVVALSSMLLYVEEDEQKRGDLESIHSSAKQASELINKLRTFSQKNTTDHEIVNMKNMMTDTMQLVKPRYRKKYRIEENYHDGDIHIVGDKTQLSQMIMNLVINGIEAMEKGGTLFVETSMVSVDSSSAEYMVQPDNFISDDYFCIKISDTGSGISSYMMNQIFDPYYTTKDDGTGLGLSIVYGVVTGHDGAVKLETQLDKGTTFYVYLPVYMKSVSSG